MKKKVRVGCATGVILIFGIILYIFYYLFFSMGRLPEGEPLDKTTSPDRVYTIHFYKVDSGATTDFSIRGELLNNRTNEKENIYWEYRAAQVEASWIDDHTVIINGHTLDVRKDKYDWRRE